MKRFLISALIFQTLSIFASGFSVTPIEKPLCSDVNVRLSLKPIPCIPEFGHIDFDIPQMKLNFEELQNIFNGAESSGGHIVGPMNQPQRRRPLTDFPFTLKCEARMLLDGKKKVSFLSLQNFELNPNQYQFSLLPQQWEHNLIEGSDIYATQLIAVDVAPAVEVATYQVELSYNTFYDHLQLAICENQLGLQTKSATCAQTQGPVTSNPFSVNLLKRFQGQGKVIHQTLMVTCKQ